MAHNEAHDEAPPATPRDMVGYGRTPPHPRWPGNARIAVQFVLNYEEGAENNVLDGSAGSETFLSEMVPVEAFPNRHMSMESLYEYGSRAGLWRVLRVFERRGLPLTIFAVATALQRNPEAVSAFGELGHEIACHGLRWQSYQLVPPDIEREHMAQAVQILRDLTGQAPLGWYTGRDSPQTRQLVVEHGVSPTIRIRTPMICRTGCGYLPPVAWPTIWWCPTPWTPTTCDSPRRPGSPVENSFHASAGRIRLSVRRGGGGQPEDAVGGPALPAGGPAGADGRARTVSRSCASSRRCVDHQTHRHRRTLAPGSSGGHRTKRIE